MPVIRIDDEVYKYLVQRIRTFGDTPNDVLRRLFRMNEESSQTQNDSEEQGEGVYSPKMRTIVPAALTWLHREITNPNSSISVFIKEHDLDRRDFDFYKGYVRASKYFRAENAFPGIDSYWHNISTDIVSRINDPFPFVLLLCQKEPANDSDFWCLAVPFEYLCSEYGKGNLGTLGGKICLHLSASDCTYRGYEVKIFDDVRLTMRTGHKPTPFGQFLL